MMTVNRDDLLDALTQEGDTFELGDGRTLRLRFEPDDINPFDEFDTYGKVAHFPTNTYGYDQAGMRSNFRPDGFDGNAEKLWPPQNGDPVWWQPPSWVKRSDPGFAELRTNVCDLLAFGMQGVLVELLDGEDAYRRPIARGVAALWGLEPFIDRAYLRTVVGELVDEVLADVADGNTGTEEKEQPDVR